MQALGLDGVAHRGARRRDLLDRRVDASAVADAGAARREGGAGRRVGARDEAAVDLGQDDVGARGDLGSRAHRGAEAGRRGEGALDRDDEQVGSPAA